MLAATGKQTLTMPDASCSIPDGTTVEGANGETGTVDKTEGRLVTLTLAGAVLTSPVTFTVPVHTNGVPIGAGTTPQHVALHPTDTILVGAASFSNAMAATARSGKLFEAARHLIRAAPPAARCRCGGPPVRPPRAHARARNAWLSSCYTEICEECWLLAIMSASESDRLETETG